MLVSRRGSRSTEIVLGQSLGVADSSVSLSPVTDECVVFASMIEGFVVETSYKLYMEMDCAFIVFGRVHGQYRMICWAPPAVTRRRHASRKRFMERNITDK